jgi:hypothetical protein
MDPKAVLARLERAIREADAGTGIAALNDYYQWRLKGGAAMIPQGDTLFDTRANQLIDAIEAL